MAKVRDYGKLAADIKDLIGESNILGATHCATRLRLILKEEPSDEITKKIEQKPGVIQVVKAGGQYQIVIGMHAKDVYEELSKIMTFAEDAPQAKVGLLDRLIAIMSGSITPFVYVLAGAGLLQGTLIILRLIIGEDVINPSGIGQIYDMISWTPFTFLPVFIAVSASRHFKCNTYIALWCCLALANPTWGTIAQGIAEGNGLKFGIIPLTSVTYTATVIPPIIMIGLLSMLEKWLDKRLPETIKPLLMPVCCTVVMVPLTILLIGPVSSFVADILPLSLQISWLPAIRLPTTWFPGSPMVSWPSSGRYSLSSVYTTALLLSRSLSWTKLVIHCSCPSPVSLSVPRPQPASAYGSRAETPRSRVSHYPLPQPACSVSPSPPFTVSPFVSRSPSSAALQLRQSAALLLPSSEHVTSYIPAWSVS